MNVIRTPELVDLLMAKKGRVIEVSLTNGFFNFTHFIDFRGQVICDVGIDSEEVYRRPQEFLERYKNEWWRIDQIV